MNDLQLFLDFCDKFDCYEYGFCKNSDGTFTAFFQKDEFHFNSDGMITEIVKSDDKS